MKDILKGNFRALGLGSSSPSTSGNYGREMRFCLVNFTKALFSRSVSSPYALSNCFSRPASIEQRPIAIRSPVSERSIKFLWSKQSIEIYGSKSVDLQGIGILKERQ